MNDDDKTPVQIWLMNNYPSRGHSMKESDDSTPADDAFVQVEAANREIERLRARLGEYEQAFARIRARVERIRKPEPGA